MADISHDAVQEALIADGSLFQDSSIKDNIKDFCKRCWEGTPTELSPHKLSIINEEFTDSRSKPTDAEILVPICPKRVTNMPNKFTGGKNYWNPKTT